MAFEPGWMEQLLLLSERAKCGGTFLFLLVVFCLNGYTYLYSCAKPYFFYSVVFFSLTLTKLFLQLQDLSNPDIMLDFEKVAQEFRLKN